MTGMSLRRLVVVPVVLMAVLALAPTVGASHSWGGYHWARTSNPFTLRLGDNVSSAWDSYLRAASTDWTQSSVLNTTVVTGQAWFGSCSPRSGRAEVCNANYGANGWLGLASIWMNSTNHIAQATVKMNDHYFNMTKYNTAVWRRSVMCQEIGHVFGLAHQDENLANANLGSCMDYSSDPTTNQKPNQHDYNQLLSIYRHLDSTSTLGTSTAWAPGAAAPGAAAGDANRHDEWGRAIRYAANGRPVLFERNLGGGEKQFTWVLWAD